MKLSRLAVAALLLCAAAALGFGQGVELVGAGQLSLPRSIPRCLMSTPSSST